MRRIAFVLHDLNPWEGHSRSTMEVARRISHKAGVDLYSFTFHDSGQNRPSSDVGWGDARWFHIRPNFRRPFPLRAGIFYLETALRTGLLPGWDRTKRPLIHATGACTLLSDVVQVQFVQAAWKAARETHPNLAFPGRGIKSDLRRLYHRGLSHFNIATERLAYSPAKTYIAIANVVKLELERYYGITRNVHVIHHGVDAAHFTPLQRDEEVQQLRNDFKLPMDKIVISFVGALERKGLATALEAWSLLRPEIRNKARLLAVGGGAVNDFKIQARQLGVSDQVLFLPHTKDVRRVYQASDAFLLPTLYEPFGLVILEAMACGLPAVVTKLAGASELIEDGVDGLLIQDPTDRTAIAQHLESLIENSDLRANMSKKARAKALSHGWDHVAHEYEKVLFPLAQD